MNFKEQYQSTFSQLHVSETMTKKILEAKEMERNKRNITKSKKKFMAILAAAILTAGCGAAVSASAVNGTLESIKMYINGKEVSASDYMDNGTLKVEGKDDEYYFEFNYSPDEIPEGDEIRLELETDEYKNGYSSATAIVTIE